MKRRTFARRLAAAATAALALVCGCRSTAPQIGKEEAIAVAKHEAVRRGWKELEINSTSQDVQGWHIGLGRLPKTPGGHATVEISSDGRITRFVGGK
jgi:hypothetical protein